MKMIKLSRINDTLQVFFKEKKLKMIKLSRWRVCR